MGEQKIRTALLAYGMSGKIFHAPFLTNHKGFDLTGVLERNEKKAGKEIPGIRSFSSIEELLADDSIELIIVNTPNYTHFEFAQKALGAKKHVLLEKPFTVTSDEARTLFRLADSNQVQIMAYQNRRYDTDFVSVKNIIESKQLGKIAEVHFRFDRYRLSIGPKKGKETAVPGSGILYDLGPHLIDGAISLFGKPVQWHKSTGKFRPGTIVDDYAHIHLIYPGDLQVFLTMSMIVPSPLPAFVIHGTKGSYIKQRSDVQERDLLNGLSPSDAAYGKEEKEHAGKLTLVDDSNHLMEKKILQSGSTYMELFDSVYNAIRQQDIYPVSREEILLQLTILED